MKGSNTFDCRTPLLARAMAIAEAPRVLAALTALLGVGATLAVASPQCWKDKDPIPTA